MKTDVWATLGWCLLALLVAVVGLFTLRVDQLRANVAVASFAPQVPGPTPPSESPRIADVGDLLSPLPSGMVEQGSGVLRVVQYNDPTTLNRVVSREKIVGELYHLVGGTLAVPHPEDPSTYAPDLASRVVEEVVGQTYIVHLRPGVDWHEPTMPRPWFEGPHQVTADDFVFSLEIIQHPEVGGLAAAARTYFEGATIEVTDPHTFRLRFAEARPINRSLALGLWPMPRFVYGRTQDGQLLAPETWARQFNEHWYNDHAIGTGPYRFVHWKPGQEIVLERAPGQVTAFDKIQIRLVKDTTSWNRLLKADEVEVALVEPNQVEDLLALGGFETRSFDRLGYTYLAWNGTSPLFQDRLVRQALTHALDREGLATGLLQGQVRVVSGPFTPAQPCYDSQIAPWPYDLKEAAHKLDSAGWVDSDGDGIRDKVIDGQRRDLDFSIMTYTDPSWVSMMQVYREALLEIGVRMTPLSVEWGTMKDRRVKRDFDAFTGGRALGWEPELRSYWHSDSADEAGSSNTYSFRHPESDRLIESLDVAFDPDERTALCREFHRLVHQEAPVTFLFQSTAIVVHSDRLEPRFRLDFPQEDLLLYRWRL